MYHIKKRARIKMSALLLLLFLLLVITVYHANRVLRPQLMAIATQKTNDAISMLAQKVLSAIDYDSTSFIYYHYNEEHEITAVEYDTKALNALLNQALDIMDNSLEKAENGEVDPILQEVFFSDGVIYEVPAGYLTGITFLQNYGYRFKISMRILNYVNGDLEVESEPYGINNSIIKIFLNLSIEAEAITALQNKHIHFEEKIPLIIQVVNGIVPDYSTTYQAKQNEKEESY